MRFTKKVTRKKINNRSTKKYRNIKEVIEKRYNILIIIIFVLFLIVIGNLFHIQVVKNNYYINKVKLLNRNIVEGRTAPRGRIYDRNHKLIVDNKPNKVIFYKKQNGVTRDLEIELAYKVSNIIDLNYKFISKNDLKKFWLIINNELGKEKITPEEYEMLEMRKISRTDIENLKMERITDDNLNMLNEEDQKAAYLYALMNKGYSYEEKDIKNKDVSDLEYARIAENVNELNGFNIRLDWEREYLYNDTFKNILGSVSSSSAGLPYELKEYYLSKNYNLNDRVGNSFLEFQYDDYLRGSKNKYEIIGGVYHLIEAGKRGNDIVLTIDIELQRAVEQILEEELIKAKKEPNTEHYNRSFVIITEPNTGEILAMAGKQIIIDGDDYKIYDYTPGITTSAVVAGSVVKGASHIVAYNNGVLNIGEKRDDYCIKIASTPSKCSWRYLGVIDDIAALRFSSNSYQYQSAIKIGNGKYVYNKPLSLNKEAFKIYRESFAEFGLGVKTEIDLPLESLGYKGSSTLPGHLLDFSIGQYDTYTPIQLSQYIGTIANGGNRMKMHLLKGVYDSNSEPLKTVIYNNEPVILNKITAKNEYIERVQAGFKAVIEPGGTGASHMPINVKPAGKTGTSEGFIDTDLDGIVDTETYSNNFIGYAPYDNPIVAFTVVSPDISHKYGNSRYQSPVNRRISYEVSKKFFEIYE